MFFGYNPSRSASPRSNLFDYSPSRSASLRSNLFSRPESGTRASIQPIGNPVPVYDQITQATIDRDTNTNNANVEQQNKVAEFQALLNENNINPEAFANARKRSQANRMRQAYSSFLRGLG